MPFFKKCFYFKFLWTIIVLGAHYIMQAQDFDITKQQWIHGSEDCSSNTDVKIQIAKVNDNTFILRQNKCVHYEAPFMFLFFGKEKALLFDTGATQDQQQFPLRKVIDSLVQLKENKNKTSFKLIVAHTHSHGDHHAGDIQFKDRPNTKIVGLSVSEISSFFTLENGFSTFNLGDRDLSLIHIPGHHKTSIAVYDPQTQWLLTGDTFYPGRLYVDDWMAFKQSIKKLVAFTDSHQISHILGNHIEMSTTVGNDYPMGSKYQPQEHQLPLTVKDLKELDTTLDGLGEKIQKKTLTKFIIYPNN